METSNKMILRILQYQDVMRKKAIVEADRAKLVQVMAELDEKKKRTLITACEQVNRDFGSIFSTLLPGAQAQLRPLDGCSVLDGLEVSCSEDLTHYMSKGYSAVSKPCQTCENRI